MATGFFAEAFLTATFFAAGFFAGAFLAGAFFAAGFLTAAFLAGAGFFAAALGARRGLLRLRRGGLLRGHASKGVGRGRIVSHWSAAFGGLRNWQLAIRKGRPPKAASRNSQLAIGDLALRNPQWS